MAAVMVPVDDLGTRVRACASPEEVAGVLRQADEDIQRLCREREIAIEMFTQAADELMRLRRERPWLTACIRALLDRPNNHALHRRAVVLLNWMSSETPARTKRKGEHK